METVELTESQKERVESIQTELREGAGAYATVTTRNVVEYLLDLAETIDDTDPQRASGPSPASDETAQQRFPRETLRDQLTQRNRKHSDEGADQKMDLYTIAASYDIAGRSSMTKTELIEAILDAAERRYRNPFESVDIEFPPSEAAEVEAGDDETDETAESDTDERSTNHDEEPEAEPKDEGSEAKAEDDEEPEIDAKDAEPEAEEEEEPEANREENGDAGDSDQLTAMLNLLETHDDKWRETGGDARYEVELPDGTFQTARTKDDVRALLFKNY